MLSFLVDFAFPVVYPSKLHPIYVMLDFHAITIIEEP